MSQELAWKFDELSQQILAFPEIDNATAEDLSVRISHLSTQLIIQKGLDDIIKLVREDQPLPVRRISYNIKSLSESGEPNESRWSELQKLDFRSLIFCALSFPRLTSLPLKEFSWLMQNVERYLQTRALPHSWIGRDQIRKVVTNIPRRENRVAFLESYYNVEIELCKPSDTDAAEKELPIEQMRIESSLAGDVYELTVAHAQVVVASGQIQGKIWLTDTYGANTPSFITIPVSDELTNRLIIRRPRVM